MQITVARNIKEMGCEVYPTPLRELVGLSTPHPSMLSRVLALPPPDELKRVALGEVAFELGWERYIPAELLFESTQGDDGLHALVLDAIDATVRLEAAGAIDEDLVKGTMADDNNSAAASSSAAGSGGSGDGGGGGGGGGTAGGRGKAARRPATSLRESLLGRVVLSGGSSQLPGLPTRLENELAALVEAEPGRSAGKAEHIHVRPSIGGDATTWHGASVLAGTATFAHHWCVHAPTMPMPSGYDDEDEEDVDDDDDEDDDEDDDDDDDEEEEEEEEEEDNEADAEGQAPGSAGPLPAIEDVD